MQLPFILIILLHLTTKCCRASACKNFNVSLIQKIDGEGFHREINWLLERDRATFPCKLVIKMDVSSEIFINPDEIADLNRLGRLSMFLDGDVDVEAPAHLAEKYTAYAFVAQVEEKVSINVPFHLRYQRAQISGGHGKLLLNKPSVLALCPQKCSKTTIVAPCDITNKNQCAWNNMSYQALFDEVELLVPVGDLDDYPLVSVVTLLLGCAGCIYTLSVLSTTPL